MSRLKERLANDLKEAMRNKENFKRDVIRFVMSALKQIEVDERRELSDEDIIKIIQKLSKQREEAAAQFKEAGRPDLYEKEMQENIILSSYLPKQLDDEELEALVRGVIAECGATQLKDLGTVMGLAMKASAGQADGKRINAVAKTLLS